MNRAIYATTAAAIACSVGLAAQSNRNPSSEPAPVVLTVVGCVEPMDQSAAKTGGSQYKLSHAKSKNPSPQNASGRASQAPTATTYRLDSAQNSTLAQDVGDQVEIVAIVVPVERSVSGEIRLPPYSETKNVSTPTGAFTVPVHELDVHEK